MNRRTTLMLGLAAALVVFTGAASGQDPMGTAFTYQGRLEQGGSPVTGDCDMMFSLWDDDTVGT